MAVVRLGKKTPRGDIGVGSGSVCTPRGVLAVVRGGVSARAWRLAERVCVSISQMQRGARGRSRKKPRAANRLWWWFRLRAARGGDPGAGT